MRTGETFLRTSQQQVTGRGPQRIQAGKEGQETGAWGNQGKVEVTIGGDHTPPQKCPVGCREEFGIWMPSQGTWKSLIGSSKGEGHHMGCCWREVGSL